MTTSTAIAALVLVILFGFAPICAVAFLIQNIRLTMKNENLRKMLPQMQKEDVKKRVEKSLSSLYGEMAMLITEKKALSDKALEYVADMSKIIKQIKDL